MQTATIPHPGDPLGDGRPITAVVRDFTRIEAMKIRASAPKAAYQVVGSDRVVLRNAAECDDRTDPQYYFLAMKRSVTEVLNGPLDKDGKPMPLSDDCIWQLFDEKYDVQMAVVDGDYIGVATKTADSENVSFPYYVTLMYGKGVMRGTLFPVPTPAQSAPS